MQWTIQQKKRQYKRKIGIIIILIYILYLKSLHATTCTTDTDTKNNKQYTTHNTYMMNIKLIRYGNTSFSNQHDRHTYK